MGSPWPTAGVKAPKTTPQKQNDILTDILQRIENINLFASPTTSTSRQNQGSSRRHSMNRLIPGLANEQGAQRNSSTNHHVQRLSTSLNGVLQSPRLSAGASLWQDQQHTQYPQSPVQNHGRMCRTLQETPPQNESEIESLRPVSTQSLALDFSTPLQNASKSFSKSFEHLGVSTEQQASSRKTGSVLLILRIFFFNLRCTCKGR